MKKINIAINGFGRIGRSFFRIAYDNPVVNVAAINDLGDVDNLAYLLKYDSVYGQYEKSVKVKNGKLIVEGKDIAVFQEKDPAALPWGDLDVDVVVESTGFFTDKAGAQKHIAAGAKRVVVSAPTKDEIATVLVGVNEEKFKDEVLTCNASCTTNAASPVIGVLKENPGIKKALLNTVHGYTATQNLVDGPAAKDFRRGRAAAINIVPSSTGAAQATTKAHSDLDGLFDGVALRVPVATGSIADITFLAARPTSVEEINDILREASKSDRWKKVLAVSDEPLVSSDIIKSPYGSIVDASMTRVVDGDLVKVLAWYDNEWGYSATLLEHVLKTAIYL